MGDSPSDSLHEARAKVGVADERFPRSVAIIMDGNGRWAQARGLPRSHGHREGAKRVRRIVQTAARLGLDALTLYSFSIENWNRPREEINVLMGLYAEYLINERPTLMENNVRLVHLGRREQLPKHVLAELDESLRASAGNTGMRLCLALNYGSRAEILDAVQSVARRVAAGKLSPDAITETDIDNALYTTDVPDPDLVIRTSGELRLSNFLLWQVSYAEFYATKKHWPDFDDEEFYAAIRDYAGRDRRFGTLSK